MRLFFFALSTNAMLLLDRLTENLFNNSAFMFGKNPLDGGVGIEGSKGFGFSQKQKSKWVLICFACSLLKTRKGMKRKQIVKNGQIVVQNSLYK